MLSETERDSLSDILFNSPVQTFIKRHAIPTSTLSKFTFEVRSKLDFPQR
jgi:hypothetical protein